MDKRPISVTVIGCVYILTGAIALAGQVAAFRGQNPFQYDVIGIALVRLSALVAGVFMLWGRNWARWLALAWIAFHVIIAAFHNLREVAIHSVICAIIAYVLLRPAAARYFAARQGEVN